MKGYEGNMRGFSGVESTRVYANCSRNNARSSVRGPTGSASGVTGGWTYGDTNSRIGSEVEVEGEFGCFYVEVESWDEIIMTRAGPEKG